MALPLPARINGTYFTLWGGGTRITAVPTSFNLIYLFHAVPAGNGAFRFEYGNAVNAAEIKQVQARGQRVVLTVGGANAGFNFTSRAQAQNFVDSFKAMNQQLGGTLDGCDFNNFEARIGSSPTEMTWISQQLKAAYGKDFSISAPPAPGAGWAPMDRVLCKAMMDAGVMDYAAPQFYDSSDLTQLSTITSLTEDWIKNVAGGDASKIVIGLTSNYGAGPTLATSKQAWSTLVAKYPNLRGVFAWSAQDDAGAGWAFANQMGALVGAKPSTGGSTPAPSPAPAPAPAPTTPPATGAVVDFKAGTPYKLGQVVKFTDGKYYEVYQVDASGTSNGTQPIVSHWYWRETKAPTTGGTNPAPAPAPTPPVGVKAGDKVSFTAGTVTLTGAVSSVSGANAVVKIDQATVPVSALKKV